MSAFTNFLRFLFMPVLVMIFIRSASSQETDISVTIFLRGVHSSDITLMAHSPTGIFKPVVERKGVLAGDTALLVLPASYLPGEFVLRFDYRENANSTPYPSEKYLFLNDQDLEFRVSPMFVNNPDSSYFQPGERENAAFTRFSLENNTKREKLGLLEYFLMNYDDANSSFYQMGVQEYEKRRKSYNQWLKDQVEKDNDLFVSSMYSFHFVPGLSWEGSEKDRIINLIDHYFDGIDLNDPRIIRTTDMKKWMDAYVNLYGQLTTSVELRDSLFPAAGRNAIERAKQGHPLVYGWMVDYFYRGYEANGIDAGMKILEPYVNDTNCLTTKRLEINRRLEGMKTLVAGHRAPDIEMNDTEGSPFKLSEYQTPAKYILVLFWSADCAHCMEMINDLYPWQKQEGIREKLDVVAISLDETETEIEAWQGILGKLTGWKHLRAVEGINSKVAMDYYVLATPVMILLDPRDNSIVATPGTLEELRKYIR